MLTVKEVFAPTTNRTLYLGGTDAAPILGLSRWKTAVDVWSDKTGLVEREDISNRLPVILGNRLEQTVAELFTEATGKRVRRANETFFHPQYEFIGANIDRRVVGENAILECKTASAWKSKEWESDEIPFEYVIQVVHYLAVTGADKAYVAVLIGNEKFLWKCIDRDEKLVSDLISREVDFWKRFVLTGDMPQVTKRDADTLSRLFPTAEPGKEITLGDEADKLLEMRNALHQDHIELEGQIEKIENEIRALMKDAEIARTPNYLVTWKPQTSKRFDSTAFKSADPETYAKFLKETTTRSLRIRKGDTHGNSR
jgi:putative phage-type endonuclease